MSTPTTPTATRPKLSEARLVLLVETLYYLDKRIQARRPPTLLEMALDLGLSSKSGGHYRLKLLLKFGLVQRGDRKAKMFRPSEKGARFLDLSNRIVFAFMTIEKGIRTFDMPLLETKGTMRKRILAELIRRDHDGTSIA